MHRDMKVGLSLGVLLVGVVGALFFRREAPGRTTEIPALKSARQLDEQISDRRLGPYITGAEDGHETTPAPDPSPRSSSAIHELPKSLQADSAAREPHGQALARAPEPLSPLAPPGQPAPHNVKWEQSEGKSLTKSENSLAAEAASAVHVIRTGDTLSSLASQYLGNGGRYREIFEANRHILRSPDDLPEGASIVIPRAKSKPGSSANTAARTDGAAGADAANLDIFQRERRSPARPPRDEPSPSIERGTTSPSASPPAMESTIRFRPVKKPPFAGARSRNKPAVNPTPAPRAPTASKEPAKNLDDVLDLPEMDASPRAESHSPPEAPDGEPTH